MAKHTKKARTKRMPFDWAKLKKMAESGASILEIAEATDPHFRTSKSEDKTKPTRARLSLAATKGVRVAGRLVRFKRRSKPVATKTVPKKKIVGKKKTRSSTVPQKIAKQKLADSTTEKPEVDTNTQEVNPS